MRPLVIQAGRTNVRSIRARMESLPTMNSPCADYTGPVLYPFGYGLSYTTFNLSGSCNTSVSSQDSSLAMSLSRDVLAYAMSKPRVPVVSCSVTVTNTGGRTGDEVVVVYTGPNATTFSAARVDFGLPDPDPLAIKQVVDCKFRKSVQAFTYTHPYPRALQLHASVSSRVPLRRYRLTCLYAALRRLMLQAASLCMLVRTPYG